MSNKPTPPASPDDKMILRGIGVSLTEAMRRVIEAKVERLLRHEPRIVRVRIDVEKESTARVPRFIAKGHIEIGGPDLIVSVTDADAYKAADLLVNRLDRQLRKRTTAITSRRQVDDIRRHDAGADGRGKA